MASGNGACVLALLALMVTGSQSQSACGNAALNTRIVGGVDTVEGAWPWQASLHRNGRHACGGSLINDRSVLSAAHCFASNPNASIWGVYLGRQFQSGENLQEQFREVRRIAVHPDYNPFDNDIAVLELSSPVTYTNYIQPVCLAAPGSSIGAGTVSWVTGFGLTSEGGDVANTLQEVDVLSLSNSDCAKVYESIITENMICAGVEAGGKDSCQGDSGGPMVHKQSSIWVQTGVVSFGDGCARPGVPGVYARVSQYKTWIDSHVTGHPPGYVSFFTADMTTTSTASTASPGSNGSTASNGGAARPLFLLSLLPVFLSLFILSGWEH